MSGPLSAIRVIEFAGLGPTPFSCMMLADMGANVLRIDKLGAPPLSAGDARLDYLNRSRPSIALNLKSPDGVALARDLVSQADVLVEGFRPGVMERLGLGPEELMAANARLIYARMTGWGQSGPLAQKAGHDINYLALTGGLHLIGPADRPPPPPLNLTADFGGGAMFMIAGVLAALVARATTGVGQVIDAAMVDGASSLLTQIFAWKDMGFWRNEREANLLDGAAYFYRCYETADGEYIAVGAIEPQFHAELLRGLGLDPAEFPDHMNRAFWAERSERLAAIFRTRRRDEWVEAFEPFDACVTPVLTLGEAVSHPANMARQVHVADAHGAQPAPAPRFQRTPSRIAADPGLPGEGGAARLRDWGIDDKKIGRLRAMGLLRAL